MSRLDRVRLAGGGHTAQVADAVITGELSLSVDQTAQLSLTLDDPGLRLLGAGLLDSGSAIALDDVGMVACGIDVTPMSGDTPAQSALTAQAAVIRGLKKRKGAHTWRTVAPTAWLAGEVKAAGGSLIGQDSPSRPTITRKKKQSSWTLAQDLARQLGYWCFEAGGVVYFGQPTWLIGRDGAIRWDLHWHEDADQRTRGLAGISSLHRADDAPKAATVELTLDASNADTIRPGHLINLTGCTASFDGRYIVSDVSIPLPDGVVDVIATTPINPAPQPADSGSTGGANGLPGGRVKLRALLSSVGFSGHKLDTAVGVAQAESGSNALAVGDVALEDSKWGPSVGLFQIRSLRHPGGYTGTDGRRVQARLTDPVYNAKLAYDISKGGTWWYPWSTYNTGAYRSHVHDDPWITGWTNPASSSSGGATNGKGGRASSPVPGYTVTYPWGVRNSRYAAGHHTGQDYACPVGTRVVAVRDGVIHSASWQGAYGNAIVLRVGGFDYMYCHLSRFECRPGQRVAAGQTIGLSGNTGNTTGPHCHFEMRPAGGGYGTDRKPTW